MFHNIKKAASTNRAALIKGLWFIS